MDTAYLWRPGTPKCEIEPFFPGFDRILKHADLARLSNGPVTNIYEIDPLRDPRWPRFVKQHKHATVFHSAEWLDALSRTYRYRPAALTISPPGTELSSGLAFCRVESWLTGSRLVSVPFSDHCAPLVESWEQLGMLLRALKRECNNGRRKYIEIRSLDAPSGVAEFSESRRFCLHRLDLRPSLDDLFRGLHASCIRRRVTRATREDFEYREGRSEDLLLEFYRLAVLTRRRQNLPPQPLAWFRNLIRCLGDGLKIRLLFHSGRPAAGILTLRFRDTMTYKYGFSDREFHRLGSMQLLMWKAIEEAKKASLLEFDMGRSEWSNPGLITFKDRFGCARSSIVYMRFPGKTRELGRDSLKMRLARHVFALAPNSLLMKAGNLLYRHMA